MKIPLMIYILKSNELHPYRCGDPHVNSWTILPASNLLYQNILSSVKAIVDRKLLEYMIEYSDNNAAQLLAFNIDGKLFQELFTEYDFAKAESLFCK